MTPLVGVFSTLADVLRAAAEQHGERAAFVEGVAGGERLSFADWHRRADALAGTLVDRGVRPGDVVVIMLPTSIDYAVAYGAITIAGGVATGLNTRLGEREIRAILDRAQPSAAILDRDAFAVVPPDATVVDRSELPSSFGGQGLGARRPRREPSDAAVIIWTSGTTGAPKGAWFDHRNLRAAVASAGVMSNPYDVKLVGTPFPHAGYMAKIWDQLAWGTTIVIAPTPWRASDMLRLLVDERITLAGGVPAQWAKLLEEPGVAVADMSRVRLGLVATAPAAPELIERVESTIGCPLVVRYAMTESPSITGTEPDDDPDVQYRTVGRPQAGMEVDLVDRQGASVARGDVGRVRVRGACVMRGYWADPELTASVLDGDGWLTSSDLGRLDAAGNLVLAARHRHVHPWRLQRAPARGGERARRAPGRGARRGRRLTCAGDR
ncbi:MAG: class I adenylate-forming enzyme family protein [Acidimicrobiia bacterium]